jgi:hypothetical protein
MKGMYLMELDDEAPVNDVVVEDSTFDNDVEISLIALIGYKTSDTMHLVTTVMGASLQALVDLGSTNSFITTDTTYHLVLTPDPTLTS